VIFSGDQWAAVDRMILAAIPPNDTNLIGYFHSYDPYPFGLNGPGTYGSDADIAATKGIFDRAANWTKTKNIPVVISELGATKLCAYNSRMYCYFTVIDQALSHGIAFDAWDDYGDFTIYDRNLRTWNDIKDILIYTYNESPTKLKISQPASDSVLLNWTNRTTKNDSIVVERKTSVGAAFDTIAIIGPTMTSFVDTAVTYGKAYYYRLQTHIKDSIYPMSYPISIAVKLTSIANKIANQKIFTIYPNPAKESIRVSWPNSTGSAEVFIIDCLGNTVLSKKIENIQNQDCAISLSNIPSGMYILKFKNNSAVFCRKIYVNK
jgi:hypothetical protein